ncbi:TetR/AcrR family transcriptional regulator [Aneurinibacillus migulanus]|uniref:Transcriptional regulator, TetR family n=1 Tax=Aneurinibacillus migulanus TaxID=47500 RepID=A0A0M0H3S0_ANEMI|nr:TetR/AcrR family transcriptional regulator [Aneurinibacillus migulanus]KON96356.1 hypothetical protein AF333_13590 [Aneurinibacillus migulanus]MCP1357736.1 TetR/AcrR family transcriptional regulator [Aneurinibacillus migulanus]MED0892282.1 TetR/AcrR family transcriptional regulator [Aneurinibacillus migulanus]MED1615766.1 TetR/AcrR family transcriptional regulator [Aneurinibacillus migulanus]MED4731053.1 TetR/AcrR family transcriptional regulator [Aneurinibacillus migulanus]
MTRDNIKAAALILFARNGYEGTYLSEIANQVGIRKPSIYNHFSSKEELFLSVFEDVMWAHVKQIETLVEKIKDASVEDKLYQIFNDTFQMYIEEEEVTAFYKRAVIYPPEHLKEFIREKIFVSEEALSCILRDIFAEGIKNNIIREEKMEVLLASYYCLIDGMFMQLSFYGEDTIKPRVKSVWQNYWRGIENVSYKSQKVH